jgi:uncharacterized protein GlcG (DUF336 family)
LKPALRVALAAAVIGAGAALSSCGGGGGIPDGGCTGFCATNTPSRLEVADVQQVIAQAVFEAQARGAHATIAVVDRVGNVLAIYRMTGASTSVTITSGRGVQGGLEGIQIIPDTLAAIAKAITGAYLSSEGNAFSTRTASQIVQEHFNPGTTNAPAGPLFGVQFSQLPCSDLNTRFNGATVSAGPQRSPLGLSADPGGFPLYKNGTPVGGVGVIADGIYGLDLNIRDTDRSVDEIIALAATGGFSVPSNRSADHISAGGLTLRFSDATGADLKTNPANATPFASLTGADGALVALTGYTNGTIVAGTQFGQPDSGIRAATDPDFAARDAFVLVDDTNTERFPPTAASDAGLLGANALTALEVKTILKNALSVANQARAQIRQPLNSQARVTISVVDTYGAVLGIVRTRDAPVFGIDVSLQKARTAAFFSDAAAAGDLQADADAIYLNADGSLGAHSSISAYLTNLRSFLGLPNALADGAYAFTDRAGGNMSRPFYPDGQDAHSNGPFSKPFASWSPFSDGLQLDLNYNAIIQHVVFTLGGGPDVAAGFCNGFPVTPNGKPRLANGSQIFPGSVPIYRGNTLVGAIGVSGDGVDQDDMVSFLGLHDAGVELSNGIGNAPSNIRADQLAPGGVNLRYVECPQAPFLNSSAQNVCEGK